MAEWLSPIEEPRAIRGKQKRPTPVAPKPAAKLNQATDKRPATDTRVVTVDSATEGAEASKDERPIKDPDTRRQIRMSQELWSRIQAEADRLQISAAAVVRMSVAEHLDSR